MTPCAAKWIACWLDPHWRSTVVPGTVSGKPAARAALRPTFRLCSPTWLTQPIMTSSTRFVSILVRWARVNRTWAIRSTGCQSFNRPFLRPTAVRTASTITASRIVAMNSSLLETLVAFTYRQILYLTQIQVFLRAPPAAARGVEKKWGHPLWRQLKHLNNRKEQRDLMGTALAGRTGSDVGVRAADAFAAR